MTFRFTDESVLIDFPEFVAADPNAIPSATRSGVGSGKGPMEFDAGRHVFELIECHDHVGKIAHESACNLCDRNRRSAVHANRSGLRIKCSDLFRFVVAPRLGVTVCERYQFRVIVHLYTDKTKCVESDARTRAHSKAGAKENGLSAGFRT